MLVQPQQAATVCGLDLVQHASGHGNGLRPWIRTNGRRTAHEPLNLTLDFEHAHVSGHSRETFGHAGGPARTCRAGMTGTYLASFSPWCSEASGENRDRYR